MSGLADSIIVLSGYRESGCAVICGVDAGMLALKALGAQNYSDIIGGWCLRFQDLTYGEISITRHLEPLVTTTQGTRTLIDLVVICYQQACIQVLLAFLIYQLHAICHCDKPSPNILALVMPAPVVSFYASRTPWAKSAISQQSEQNQASQAWKRLSCSSRTKP